MVKKIKESWDSRLGVILAVSGSAVGLGNFLRFPGNVAQYGGGAFMIAYFIGFIFLGLPICWAEWIMGRRGGQAGVNSSPAILTALSQKPWMKWIGIIGIIVPVVIYMYYVYIEAWCLGYAFNFLSGDLKFHSIDESTHFWAQFIGVTGNGSAVGFSLNQVGIFLIFCFILNFVLIYRGVSKGIELFCKYAMPALFILALIILIRVLTMGIPDENHPERNVNNGLGFMWNPNKVFLEEKNLETGEWAPVSGGEVLGAQRARAEVKVSNNPNLRLSEVRFTEQLLKPDLWLAAVGQIFFSLSVGFGIIITYASYMKKEDDVILSGLSAAAANEFAEVGLGGLITLPAAVLFIGTAGLAGAGLGTFDLGFKVLPLVFSSMPLGNLFGFLFFFLLFLAAVTSSLSMLQPGIAFLEESLSLKRRQSVTILGFITALGTLFVFYFSADAKALDTLDFWGGTFLIFILAAIEIFTFSWIIGIERGKSWAKSGSIIQIPRVFWFIMEWVSPIFLIIIFAMWILSNFLGISFSGGDSSPSYYITDLFRDKNPIAWISIGIITLIGILSAIIIRKSPLFKNIHHRTKGSQS